MLNYKKRMKTFKKLILSLLLITLFTSCGDMKTDTIQIGENTFLRKEKVYRIIDNQITELGDFKTDSITKSSVLNPKLKNYGENALDYIRKGVSSKLTAIYRGDILYFKMNIEGLNNLRDKYYGGGLSINFLDEYGFQIHITPIEMNELIMIVDNDNKPVKFEYNGKTQMSSEVYKAISTYSVTSSLR